MIMMVMLVINQQGCIKNPIHPILCKHKQKITVKTTINSNNNPKTPLPILNKYKCQVIYQTIIIVKKTNLPN